MLSESGFCALWQHISSELSEDTQAMRKRINTTGDFVVEMAFAIGWVSRAVVDGTL